MKILKMFLFIATAAVITVSAATVYTLTKMSTFEVIMCSVETQGYIIPSFICRNYLESFRYDEKGVADLRHDGLDPILNLDNPEKYVIAKSFIELGLDVNAANQNVFDQPSDATPLHASVLTRDLRNIEFLLANGADRTIRSKTLGNMTALELAEKSQEKDEALEAIIIHLQNGS